MNGFHRIKAIIARETRLRLDTQTGMTAVVHDGVLRVWTHAHIPPIANTVVVGNQLTHVTHSKEPSLTLHHSGMQFRTPRANTSIRARALPTS